MWLWAAAWAAPHFAWPHTFKLGSSWDFFPQGARLLFSGHGLHLYSRAPFLQIGPLALLAAEPLRFAGPSHGRYVATALMTAAGPCVLALCARIRIAGDLARRSQFLLAGVALLMIWPELAARFGHLDDVLAILFTVAGLVAVEEGCAVSAGILLAAAADSKPWAAAFVPLLFALERPLRFRAALAWAGGVAVVWLPFLVADSHGLWKAARFRVGIDPTSSLRVFGVHAARMPVWDRPAQLLAGLAVAALLVARGRWPGAVLGAIAVRLVLDPRAQTYYTSDVVVAAVVADLWLTRRRLPLFTIAAVVLLYAVLPIGIGDHALGALRAAYCLAVIAMLPFVRRQLQ